MEPETARQTFAILLVSGVMLTAVEIFVPGGVLGAVGAVAIIGAVIMGFVAFPEYGGLIAAAIAIGGALAFALWLKIAPNTWIGKKLTIARDLKDSKSTKEGIEDLLHKRGTAMCNLRPAGFARIDGHRVDVVTAGELIEAEATVEVIDVESNRVVVREVTTS
jgi:membrane-bound ClpP family serine protease